MIRKERATLVEYAVLGKTSLAVWVVSSKGLLCECRRVELRLADVGGSLAVLLEVLRCAMGARGRADIARDAHLRRLDGAEGPERAARSGGAGAFANASQSEIRPERVDPDELERQRVIEWISGLPDRRAVPSPHSPKPDEDELWAAVSGLGSTVECWQGLRALTDEALRDCCEAGPATRQWVLSQVRYLFDEDRLLCRLHDLLIAPIEHGLRQAGGEELLIVPDLELATVPWAALRGSDGRYLVEDFAIRMAPSLTVARKAVPVDGAPQQGGHKVAVVGNPWPTGHGRDFYPLMEAESEADELALLFPGARLLKGPQATRSAVLAALDGAGLAHLACHGWLERDALVLATDAHRRGGAGGGGGGGGGAAEVGDSGGLLAKEDLLSCGVRLAPGSTVVLSACNTGRGAVRGEGVVGLARAFLAAGAGAVVMSLWSVPDRHTRLLMRAVYCALARGVRAPQALRFGMLMMLRHGAAPARRAVAWAGFVAVGGSTALPAGAAGPAGCEGGAEGGGGGGLASWGVDEVAALFGRCGLADDTIVECGVNGATLLALTDGDLEESLRLTPAQRRRLRAALRAAVAGRGLDVDAEERRLRRSDADWFRLVAAAE